MKNRGSTPILTRNIHTKFETNMSSGLREKVEKLKQQRRLTHGDR